MSVTINDVLYTRIGTTNTARVGTEDGSKYAVSKSKTGEIYIFPYVQIEGIKCTVGEIGKYAFYCCKSITSIIIPSTIKTLKTRCFCAIALTKPLIIPSSVTTVETFFIDGWSPSLLIFCGANEPKMVNIDYDNYISKKFTNNVIVPTNYNNEKFCLKPIEKKLLSECSITKLFVKNALCRPSFQIYIIISTFST